MLNAEWGMGEKRRRFYYPLPRRNGQRTKKAGRALRAAGLFDLIRTLMLPLTSLRADGA